MTTEVFLCCHTEECSKQQQALWLESHTVSWMWLYRTHTHTDAHKTYAWAATEQGMCFCIFLTPSSFRFGQVWAKRSNLLWARCEGSKLFMTGTVCADFFTLLRQLHTEGRGLFNLILSDFIKFFNSVLFFWGFWMPLLSLFKKKTSSADWPSSGWYRTVFSELNQTCIFSSVTDWIIWLLQRTRCEDVRLLEESARGPNLILSAVFDHRFFMNALFPVDERKTKLDLTGCSHFCCNSSLFWVM